MNLVLGMESYKSVNPFTEECYKNFEMHNEAFVDKAIRNAMSLKSIHPKFDFQSRMQGTQHLAEQLRAQKESLALRISTEMGKVLAEARAEIEKCAWLCDYYLEHGGRFLASETVNLGSDYAIRSHEPLGLVLGIMPWNFPFWQVFRFAIPAILAGNKVLVKHAPNCPDSAEALNELFKQSFETGAYQNLRLSHDQVAQLLTKPEIKALSLTGSTKAGSEVAQIAAKNLKPQLLELGGSNAFILFEGADFKKAASLASKARLLNAGQSCIASKRFIVHQSLFEEFKKELIQVFREYKMGDPLAPQVDIGPLARKDLADKVSEQLRAGVEAGAKILLGGNQHGNFIEPTIVEISDSHNPLFHQEVFGPVATLIAYQDREEAIALSNQNPFGLGVSLIGNNLDELLAIAPRFEEGAVFINELVKSDPRLPFGGVKSSGYGRELGPEGIRSFTNLKTIYMKEDLE